MTKKRCSDSFTLRCLKAARGAGWTVRDSRNGFVLLSPDGCTRVPLHLSESNAGKSRTAGRLRAAGLAVQP